MESRAAAGVEDLRSRPGNGSEGSPPAGVTDQKRKGAVDDDDSLFLQLHAAQFDVLAPTHRGVCNDADTTRTSSHVMLSTQEPEDEIDR